MSSPSARPPERGSAGVASTAGSHLLIDQFLPTYDVGVVHADVFRAPPARCRTVADTARPPAWRWSSAR
jgi:hypothetical protein